MREIVIGLHGQPGARRHAVDPPPMLGELQQIGPALHQGRVEAFECFHARSSARL
ncbi:hypothetical protein [Allochromatium palmeri]|uniref:Uncharacterized protein n=1 Tax=Allochromatium palmeri TaxID=231048 RepID=A0A6N8EJT8_9GAMM|nr:hypothetical protein [Allochromatium palmeri]MTW23219.1 hypothetical protein [Allochromatium palmeri]